MIRPAATLAAFLAVGLPAAAQDLPEDALATLSQELNAEDEAIRTTFAAVGCQLTVGFQERIRGDLVFATIARRNAADLNVAAADLDVLEAETRIAIPLDTAMPLLLTATGGDEDDRIQFLDSFGGECGDTGCQATVDIVFFPIAVRGDDHETRADAVVEAMTALTEACRADTTE